MKTFLLPHLICPACLPKEYRLLLASGQEKDGDIVTGQLSCAKCQRTYPIKEGVALLVPDPVAYLSAIQGRYEDPDTINRYLWSHYADLAHDPANGEANAAWAEGLANGTESALDAGCSVGRVAFEMAAKSAWAVGCDLSQGFIKAARRLAREGSLTFSLPLEGSLRETFQVKLPEHWSRGKLDFVVADALRLPFQQETFQQTASLNVLDRIGYPLAHLYEMNRVARARRAHFLFASPFSWTTSEIPEERWLGGTATGPYQGRGLENVQAILEGKGRIISPPWRIARSRSIEWRMRSHSNHCELFKSCVLIAER